MQNHIKNLSSSQGKKWRNSFHPGKDSFKEGKEQREGQRFRRLCCLDTIAKRVPILTYLSLVRQREAELVLKPTVIVLAASANGHSAAPQRCATALRHSAALKFLFWYLQHEHV